MGCNQPSKSITINSSFELSLLKTLNKSSPDGNKAISPMSIFWALAMTVNGCSGDVHNEILKVLGGKSIKAINNNIKEQVLSDALTTKGVNQLKIANAIFPKEDPSTDFQKVVESVFNGVSERLQSAEQVNSWVKNNTGGKIEKIVEQVTSETEMIILNAVYFKGNWDRPFKKENTSKSTFHDKNNSEIIVDMMKQQLATGFYEDGKIQMINLPYVNGVFNAFIILPEGNIDDFISNLKQEEFDGYFNKLTQQTVILRLPKFKIETGLLLNNPLIELGMPKAFRPSDDFHPMCGKKGLYISEAVHKVFIQIDEEGTEATAATSVVISRSISEMTVDRPFLFILRGKNIQQSLFIIKVETF